MRETSTSEGGNYPPILPVGVNLQESRWDFFTCGKAGTWDILFYFPSEGSWIFRMPEKSNGFGRV
jgi:hypothetical protein